MGKDAELMALLKGTSQTRGLLHSTWKEPRNHRQCAKLSKNPQEHRFGSSLLRLLLRASTNWGPEKGLFIGQVPKTEGLADIPFPPYLSMKTPNFSFPFYDVNDRYRKAK